MSTMMTPRKRSSRGTSNQRRPTQTLNQWRPTQRLPTKTTARQTQWSSNQASLQQKMTSTRTCQGASHAVKIMKSFLGLLDTSESLGHGQLANPLSCLMWKDYVNTYLPAPWHRQKFMERELSFLLEDVKKQGRSFLHSNCADDVGIALILRCYFLH